jgi:hypothetical protein
MVSRKIRAPLKAKGHATGHVRALQSRALMAIEWSDAARDGIERIRSALSVQRDVQNILPKASKPKLAQEHG